MSAGRRTVVAVDVGGTGIKAARLDEAGVVVQRVERATPIGDGPEAVVEAVRAAACQVAAAGVVAAGVVVPGSVDARSGVARYSANIGWRDVPLRDLLAADLGVPVVLEHDVRAAGLAERAMGRARGLADCLLVVIGTGIAGVIVAGGLAVRGSNDLAGEIGHVPVHPGGEQCACGQQGCLEAYASAGAIARRYAALAGRSGRPPLSARDIAAARATDVSAGQVWHDAADALGIALASYTMLLDPALVVFGGGLAEAGDALLDPIRAALDSRLTWRPAPPLDVSPLGSRAGQMGAAVLAWQTVGSSGFSSWGVRT